MRHTGGLAVGLATAIGLLSPSLAQAKTVTIGQLFTPNLSCNQDLTILQLGAAGRTYRVPKAGVLTSWSFKTGATIVPNLTLKVARPSGGGYLITGQDKAGTQTPNSVNTYKAKIPVKKGELIGVYENGGNCASITSSVLDVAALAPGDLPPGTDAVFETGGENKIPVSAKIKTRG